MGNEKTNSSPQNNPAGEPPARVYEIKVKGCLEGNEWTEWFGGMDLSIDPETGETILRGPVADQAELYGLLSRLRNRGLTLVWLQLIEG